MSAYPGRLGLLRARPGRFQLAGMFSGINDAPQAATLSFAGAARRFITALLSGSVLSFIGGLSVLSKRAVAFAAALGFATRLFASNYFLRSTLGFVGSRTAAIFTHLSPSSVLFTGEVSRMIGAVRPAALNLAGTIARQCGKQLDASLALAASLPRAIATLRASALGLGANLSKQLSRNLASALTFVGAPARYCARQLSGNLSSAGQLARTTVRRVSGTMGLVASFLGARATLVTKSLTGALNFAGSRVGVRVPALRWLLRKRTGG